MALLILVIPVMLIACGDSYVMLKKIMYSVPGYTGNVIRIGTPLTFSSKMGRTLLRSYELFFERLHKEQGGVWLDGVQHRVELVLGDDEGKASLVTEITEQLLHKEGIRLFLATHSSKLTYFMANVVNRSDAVMVAGGAGDKRVFINRPRVFGTLTPSDLYLASVFPILEDMSRHVAHPSILNSDRRVARQPRTVVSITPEESNVCNSISSYANKYNLTYLGRVQFDSEARTNSTLFDQKVHDIIKLQPDLVVGCNLEKATEHGMLCTKLVKEFHKHEFTPMALLFTKCVGTYLSLFREELGHLADYVMGISAWQEELPLRSQLAQLTASEFAILYREMFEVEDVPYQAASAWAAAEALVVGIQRASSTDPGEVANAIANLDFQSLSGRIAFDGNGQSLNSFAAVQIPDDGTASFQTVWPPSLSTSKLVYPAPSHLELECYRNYSSLYGIDPNSSQCLRCPRGHTSFYDANVSLRFCIPCEPGKFRVNDTSAECHNCTPGRFINISGSTSCKLCPRGSSTGGDVSGASHCKPCPLGKVSLTEGLLECMKCPNGSVPENQGEQCVGCKPGRFAVELDTDEVSCADCTPGTYAEKFQQIVCKECEAGSYASQQQATACAQCEIGRYQPGQSKAACIGCAADMVTMQKVAQRTEWSYLVGATNNAPCGCDKGFRAHGGECIQCGEGMDCPGMGEVNILKGYYSDLTVSVYQCFGDFLRCPGGTPGHSCAAGRRGISCAECEESKREGPNGTCTDCEGSDLAPIILVGFVAVLVGGIMYYTMSLETRVVRNHAVLLALIACSQITFFAQQLGVISMLRLEIPDSIKPFFDILQIFNFDFDLIHISCMRQASGFDHYVTTVSVLLVSFAIISVMHCVSVCLFHGCRFRERLSVYLTTIGRTFLLVFIPVVSTVLRPLHCYDHPNGKSTVREYGDVICWDYESSNDHKNMVIVGLCCLPVPIAFLAYVVRVSLQFPQKLTMGDVKFLNANAFLLARFRPGAFWYINIVLIRSVCISMIPVVSNPYMQIVLFDSCNKAFVAGLLIFRPWRIPWANALDITCSSVVLYMVNIAAFFAKGKDVEILCWICVFGVLVTASFALMLVVRSLFIVFARKRKPYQFFLCHHKARAGSFARLLKIALQKDNLTQLGNIRKMAVSDSRASPSVFLDSDDLTQLDNLFHYVEHDVEHLVIIGTPGVFLRPWCAGEMTVARLNGLKVSLLAMPGWQPPTEKQIEHFAELVDVKLLNKHSLSLEMLQTTLRWIGTLPPIQFPSHLNSPTLRSLVVLLASGAQKTQTLHQEKSVSCEVEKGALILVNDFDMEAVAAAHILDRLILPHTMNMPEHFPRVHLASEAVPPSFESVIVICTNGCFDQPGFLEVLVRACELQARVLPVLVDINFHFPTPQTLSEMCSSPSLLPNCSADQLAHMIECIFCEIAAVFHPQQSSDTILEVNAEQIANRIMSRSCKPIELVSVIQDNASSPLVAQSSRSSVGHQVLSEISGTLDLVARSTSRFTTLSVPGSMLECQEHISEIVGSGVASSSQCPKPKDTSGTVDSVPRSMSECENLNDISETVGSVAKPFSVSQNVRVGFANLSDMSGTVGSNTIGIEMLPCDEKSSNLSGRLDAGVGMPASRKFQL